jgi:O-antigen ligase
VEGNPIDRAILLIFIALGIWVILKRKLSLYTAVKENSSLFILFLFMFISILWSDYPFVSFKRWIKASGSIVMALVLLSEKDPIASLKAVFSRLVYILIPYSLVLIKYFPTLGVRYSRWSDIKMWTGVAMSKNTLGALCMICAFYQIWIFLRRLQGKEKPFYKVQRLLDIFVFFIIIWLFKGFEGAYNATSIVVFLFGVFLLLFLRYLSIPYNKLNQILFSLFGFILAPFLFSKLILGLSPIATVAVLLGRNPTLTGRTDLIWSELIPLALKSPILGVGFGGFWNETIFDFYINQAHNGYLDVFIELGTIGLIVLFIVLLAFYKKARNEYLYNRDWAIFKIAIFFMILLHNFTETSFLRSTILLWNIFIFLMVIGTTKHDDKPHT